MKNKKDSNKTGHILYTQLSPSHAQEWDTPFATHLCSKFPLLLPIACFTTFQLRSVSRATDLYLTRISS